ncbi:HNH endonuclease signature motif containing protein [Frankia sp. R82]|uniref:HNH endonuclease signature motif containing protein n=1 Tax=Frankia sp. R82 TaxID=2950553 RepID=UPI002043A836|nr:HNH endonuclease signature motif containing protein [Frankia sp. R82]MCM3884973.1 HNH endonuclease [Frankia sp. R82]
MNVREEWECRVGGEYADVDGDGRGMPVGGGARSGVWAEAGRWGFNEFVGEEVALSAKLSTAEGGRQVAFAVRVVRRLPAAVKALHEGVIDLARLVALDRLTAQLDDELVAAVVSPVLAKGGRSSLAAFAQAVRRRILRVDPDGAQRRSEKAESCRRVERRAEPDGMARLALFLPAAKLWAVWARIDRLARQTGTADGRSLDQRRADVVHALLMGVDLGRVPVELQVIVPVETLLGLAEHPGEIPGYGPIPAEVVREMSGNSRCTWRQILTRQDTGELVDVAHRRFPSAALARKVRLRNRTCTLPGCDQPAAVSDLDHSVAWADGGRTREENLAPVCRRHHRMMGRRKHHPARKTSPSGSIGPSGPAGIPAGPESSSDRDLPRGWAVEQTGPGYVTWRTPTGAQHHTHPDNYTAETAR